MLVIGACGGCRIEIGGDIWNLIGEEMNLGFRD